MKAAFFLGPNQPLSIEELEIEPPKTGELARAVVTF